MRSINYLMIATILLLLVGCKNESDITKYYFPINDLTKGKVYEYNFVGQPNIDPQYWYYQSSGGKNGEAQLLSGTLYNGKNRIQQVVTEEVVSNGMMLNGLFLYTYDSLGVQSRLKPQILAASIYPFEVKDTSHIFLYKIKIVYPDSTHTTTLTKNRRFTGKTTYTYKGKKYNCVAFDVKEGIDDDFNGRWHQDFLSKELYAENIGLIYYKKTIGKDVLEYELHDIYDKNELDKKLSVQK